MRKITMSCNKAHRRLDRYLDGELTHHAALRMEEHVNGCLRCQAYLNDARTIGRAMNASSATARAERLAPERDWRRVMEGMTRKTQFSPGSALLQWWRWLSFYPRPVWVSGFAAIALIVALAAANVIFSGSVPAAPPVVEYVESSSAKVMVLTPEEKPVTVIWLFEEEVDTAGG